MSQHENEIVRQATDRDRLLPGEDESLSNTEAEDARHWISVYSELRRTKQQLIHNLREMMERQSAEAQDELERSDVRLLQAQLERFERRLEFWRQRLAAAEHRSGAIGE